MHESTLPFLQSELEYRTARLKAASGAKRRHHISWVRRGAGSGDSHR
jgi:hypothetical protein